MNKLPQTLLVELVIYLGLALAFPSYVQAVTIAEQKPAFEDNLDTWQVIQELGTNLSGTLDKFTFRVRTSTSNINQFDFTALNSKIWDKTTNASIAGCLPPGTASDPLAGLTFTPVNGSSGYQDVTVDFSCHNYNFTNGNRYLVMISNATMAQFGGKLIRFAAGAYGAGGHYTTDQFSDGGLKYAFVNAGCYPSSYVWNSQTASSGCNVWTTPKDDLYFILTNTAPPPPPPKTPVIFIPGIGGSELKATQNIIWSAADGHGGTFSHAYSSNEKIWVNQDEAVKLGDDDYFDVLRLKSDGQISEADLSLTGNLTPYGYGDIDSFFTGMGYVKGTNYFIFPYDWRKDVRETKDDLDTLVEEAKTKSGQTKVNIVAHSMGGLVARYYISDTVKAVKVNKLIGLGIPHLGTVKSIQTLVYGTSLVKDVFGIIPLGIPASEVKDVSQNSSGLFELLPANDYFSFYDNSNKETPHPLSDERDIDNNKVSGSLNYSQTKTLLSNLGYNMTAFGIAEQFQSTFTLLLNQNNGVKLYNIIGSNQPTLGQIRETWLITWPINLIPITDEAYINGDGTVPLYSASLKSASRDVSAGAQSYYVDQRHNGLVSSDGTAMQTVKAILNEDSLPVEVKSEKIDLEGQQISLDDGELELYDDENRHTGIKDDGEIETNIPETFYSTSGKTKHAFVKKKAKKVKVKTTRKKKTPSDPKTTNVKIRHYQKDKVAKTTIYRDLPITEIAKVEFDLDPTTDTSPSLTFYSDSTKSESTTVSLTSEVTGSAALDQTPPSTKIDLSGTKNSSGVYTSPVTVTLTGNDLDSGILKIEYSLDNGKTVKTYTEPFTISTIGKTTLQVKSVDKLGNEEIPQEIVIEIAQPQSSSSSSGDNSSSTSQSTSSSSTSEEPLSTSLRVTSEVLRSDSSEVDKPSSSKDILGIAFKNPEEVTQQITESDILSQSTNLQLPIKHSKVKPVLGGLLLIITFITSTGVALLPSVGLVLTFFKPTPK